MFACRFQWLVILWNTGKKKLFFFFFLPQLMIIFRFSRSWWWFRHFFSTIATKSSRQKKTSFATFIIQWVCEICIIFFWKRFVIETHSGRTLEQWCGGTQESKYLRAQIGKQILVHKHESMHTDKCFENDGNKEIFGNTHLRAQTWKFFSTAQELPMCAELFNVDSKRNACV